MFHVIHGTQLSDIVMEYVQLWIECCTLDCVSLSQYFEVFENGFAFMEIMTTESGPFLW